MYTFKNRSNYAQPDTSKTMPTTWEQTITNREIEWKLDLNGLSYRVIGIRVNHKGSVVIPELAKVILYEGFKKGVYTPDNDILHAIADAWAALILQGDGEAYRGHNANGEGPDFQQVMTCSEGSYPYFQNV